MSFPRPILPCGDAGFCGVWQSKRLRKVAFMGWEKGDCGEAMKEVLSKGLPGVRQLHSPCLS